MNRWQTYVKLTQDCFLRNPCLRRACGLVYITPCFPTNYSYTLLQQVVNSSFEIAERTLRFPYTLSEQAIRRHVTQQYLSFAQEQGSQRIQVHVTGNIIFEDDLSDDRSFSVFYGQAVVEEHFRNVFSPVEISNATDLNQIRLKPEFDDYSEAFETVGRKSGLSVREVINVVVLLRVFS